MSAINNSDYLPGDQWAGWLDMSSLYLSEYSGLSILLLIVSYHVFPRLMFDETIP